MYDCEARVFLNVYIYLVFVGEGWLEIVPSCLPVLRKLCLVWCHVFDEDVEELWAAVPELQIMNRLGDIVGTLRIEDLQNT
jgi:hypothetical protein